MLLLVRPTDTAAVIGARLTAKATGVGHRLVAALLGRPPETALHGRVPTFVYGRLAPQVSYLYRDFAAALHLWVPRRHHSRNRV